MLGKSCKHIILTLIALMLSCFSALKAQELELLDTQKELRQQLIPLDSMIALAIENSPVVDYYGALVNKSNHEIQMARRLWHNNVFGFANYSTGDQRILTGSTALPGDVTTSSIATGYRAGVQINLPLYDITSRRSRIRLHQAERQAMHYKQEEMTLDVHRQVIDEYYMVLGAFESLKARSEGMEAMRIYYMIAEKEFKDGIISIGELSQIKNVLSTSEFYFQNAKYDFYRFFGALAALTGVSVSDLLINKQNEH